MAFELPDLPYAEDALVPYISEETIDFHYGCHHKTYIDNLNKLIVGTEFEHSRLIDIVKNSTGVIFNNAAQVWNHNFYWECLQCHGNKLPVTLINMIDLTFGGPGKFKEVFTKKALDLFGSGWVWLVRDITDNLLITTTNNAANPLLTDEHRPLLVCDVWEHAYYIDYRNDRAKYLEAFWHIINWDFISRNYLN